MEEFDVFVNKLTNGFQTAEKIPNGIDSKSNVSSEYQGECRCDCTDKCDCNDHCDCGKCDCDIDCRCKCQE